MIILKVAGQKIENVLKKYKRKISDIGLHKDLRNRKYFKKKSQKRREVLDKAKYVNKKYGK